MTSLPPNRAKTLKEAYRACDVKPLTGDDIARYYVDLSAVRNTVAIDDVSTIWIFKNRENLTQFCLPDIGDVAKVQS
jgi:hypothetical protein